MLAVWRHFNIRYCLIAALFCILLLHKKRSTLDLVAGTNPQSFFLFMVFGNKYWKRLHVTCNKTNKRGLLIICFPLPDFCTKWHGLTLALVSNLLKQAFANPWDYTFIFLRHQKGKKWCIKTKTQCKNGTVTNSVLLNDNLIFFPLCSLNLTVHAVPWPLVRACTYTGSSDMELLRRKSNSTLSCMPSCFNYKVTDSKH